MTKVKMQGKYGIDAPYVPFWFGIVSVILLFASCLLLFLSNSWGHLFLVYGIFMLACTLIYLHTSMKGKFDLWNDIFNHLDLKTNAKILDMGCGRGAVLLMAAKRIDHNGKAVGVDLWSKKDQLGNDITVTETNAKVEGVDDKVELHTANMMELPFADNSFDYVFSSLAIHNIKDRKGRDQAVREAFRVLKPGGKLVFMDISNVNEYAETLKKVSAGKITKKLAGWKGWWSGPWMPTRIISAEKINTK